MLKKRILIPSSLIDQADKDGELLGRNPDAGRIIDLIAECNGFDGHRSKKAISRLLYEEEPPKAQMNRPERKEDRGETYGSGRWERLRLGRASFHDCEAEFVHDGLVNAFGTDWGRAFPSEELVLMSFHDFLTRILTLNLPWPNGRVPPAAAMEVIWLSQGPFMPTIAPVNPNANRLGGSRKSKNKELKARSLSLMRHSSGEPYVLHVRGVKKHEEALFVFETSQDDLAFDGDTKEYCGFPIRLVRPDSENVSICDEDGRAFEFFDIAGNFAFYAVTFPAKWDFEKLFDVDPTKERWERKELETFIRALRKAQHEYPDLIRVGWYGYNIVKYPWE